MQWHVPPARCCCSRLVLCSSKDDRLLSIRYFANGPYSFDDKLWQKVLLNACSAPTPTNTFHVVFGGCFVVLLCRCRLVFSKSMFCHHDFISYIASLALMYFPFLESNRLALWLRAFPYHFSFCCYFCCCCCLSS